MELRPVAPDQVGAGNPLPRILGMEVEGSPLDGGAELALEPLGRTLADAAEGSDVVRPDQDLVFCHAARLVASVAVTLEYLLASKEEAPWPPAPQL